MRDVLIIQFFVLQMSYIFRLGPLQKASIHALFNVQHLSDGWYVQDVCNHIHWQEIALCSFHNQWNWQNYKLDYNIFGSNSNLITLLEATFNLGILVRSARHLHLHFQRVNQSAPSTHSVSRIYLVSNPNICRSVNNANKLWNHFRTVWSRPHPTFSPNPSLADHASGSSSVRFHFYPPRCHHFIRMQEWKRQLVPALSEVVDGDTDGFTATCGKDWLPGGISLSFMCCDLFYG